jgi:hypothetical protein
VIECDPALSAAVLYVAWALPLNGPVPSVEEPSMKVTVPVGTVEFPLGPVTVAVNMTDSPAVDGFSDDVTAVVVASNGAAFTTCVSACDVDPEKFASPP